LDSAKKACLRQACTLQGRGRGGLTARTARTARKEEQRRMVPRARCWRVHSALTQKVNAIEVINDRFHAACEGIQSGQLPVLGSTVGAQTPALCGMNGAHTGQNKKGGVTASPPKT